MSTKIPSNLLDEINKNLSIAGDVKSRTLIVFQTRVWDNLQLNKAKLPAYLLDNLPLVYAEMHKANDLSALSSRLPQSSSDLFEGYQKIRVQVFKKLNVVKSLIESDAISQQLLNISLDKERGFLSKLITQADKLEPIGYLIAIAIVQTTTAWQSPLWGLLGHIILMTIILIRSSLVQDRFHQRLLLSLIVVPVFRVVNSVGMILIPSGSIPPILLYYLSYGPTCIAAIVMVEIFNLSRRELLLSLQRPYIQLFVVLTGVVFGFISYFIPPMDIIVDLTWAELWLPGFALLTCAGFMQEFIFHGLIQNSVAKIYGRWSIVYTGLLFILTLIGFLSVIHLLYLLAIYLLLGWIVRITRSFIGAAFSFGIFSVIFYLVIPAIV